jgi:hypothetical protein
MAEQRAPRQRTMALTIIKAGRDTRQVVARFEAQRRAWPQLGEDVEQTLKRVQHKARRHHGQPEEARSVMVSFGSLVQQQCCR